MMPTAPAASRMANPAGHCELKCRTVMPYVNSSTDFGNLRRADLTSSSEFFRMAAWRHGKSRSSMVSTNRDNAKVDYARRANAGQFVMNARSVIETFELGARCTSENSPKRLSIISTKLTVADIMHPSGP